MGVLLKTFYLSLCCRMASDAHGEYYEPLVKGADGVVIPCFHPDIPDDKEYKKLVRKAKKYDMLFRFEEMDPGIKNQYLPGTADLFRVALGRDDWKTIIQLLNLYCPEKDRGKHFDNFIEICVNDYVYANAEKSERISNLIAYMILIGFVPGKGKIDTWDDLDVFTKSKRQIYGMLEALSRPLNTCKVSSHYLIGDESFPLEQVFEESIDITDKKVVVCSGTRQMPSLDLVANPNLEFWQIVNFMVAMTGSVDANPGFFTEDVQSCSDLQIHNGKDSCYFFDELFNVSVCICTDNEPFSRDQINGAFDYAYTRTRVDNPEILRRKYESQLFVRDLLPLDLQDHPLGDAGKAMRVEFKLSPQHVANGFLLRLRQGLGFPWFF